MAATLAPGAGAAPAPKITIAPGTVTFAAQRVGTVLRTEAITVANTGSVPLSLSSIAYRGGNKNDFIVGTDCFPSGHPATLAANSSCLIDVSFVPQALGRRTATLAITDSAPTSPQIETLKGTGTEGYYIPGQRGGVASFGDAVFHGQTLHKALSAPIVSMATSLGAGGYWLLGSDGGIFSFGNAEFYGSTGAMHLNQPVVGIAASTAGSRLLARGPRRRHLLVRQGALPRLHGWHAPEPADRRDGVAAIRQRLLVGCERRRHLHVRQGSLLRVDRRDAPEPADHRRWRRPPPAGATGSSLATAASSRSATRDFYGSTGGESAGTIVGIASTPDGRGYWISNSVGQVFKFGDAPDYGDLFRRGISIVLGVVATSPRVNPA